MTLITSLELNQIRRQHGGATLLVDFQRAGDAVFREPTEVLEVVAWVVGRPLGDEASLGNRSAIGAEGTSFHHREDFPSHREEAGVGFRFFLGFREFEGSGVSRLLGENEVVGLGDGGGGGVGLTTSGDRTVQDQLEVFSLGDLDFDFLTCAVLLRLAGGWDFHAGVSDKSFHHILAESGIPLLVQGVFDRAVEDVIRRG